MPKKKEKFILVDKMLRTAWYLCSIELYPHEDCEWVLGSSCIQLKEKAMVFKNREKAEKIAEILNTQFDEMGGHNNYKIEEI